MRCGAFGSRKKAERKTHNASQLCWVASWTAIVTPPTHTHTPHSFTLRTHLLSGCHSNGKANNSLKYLCPEAKEAREENCPTGNCPPVSRLYASSSRPCSWTSGRMLVGVLPLPHPPPDSGDDSIINQFTSCERDPAEGGNE